MKQVQLGFFEPDPEKEERSEAPRLWAALEEADQARVVTRLAHLMAKIANSRFQPQMKKREAEQNERNK